MLKLMGALLLGGSLIVFFSRSPYFGIFGVLLQALSFSGVLCLMGLPFFGLLVILIYVGGMLIIFLFSTVLSAERYPESGWKELCVFWIAFSVLVCPLLSTWNPLQGLLSYSVLSVEGDLGKVFGVFGLFTCVVAFILLVGLVVVLSFGYEQGQENLRKL